MSPTSLSSLEDIINFCQNGLRSQTTFLASPLRCLAPASTGSEYELRPYVAGTPYFAISYTWPSSDWTRLHTSNQPSTVVENGHRHESLHLSRFAHAAIKIELRRLAGQNTKIWIDHECINQSDADEKDTQVAIMDQIYSRALFTVILLEDIELSTAENAFLRAPDDYHRNPQRLVFLVQRILGARWFTRAWCSQEMILSRSSSIFVHRSDDSSNPISFIYTGLAGIVEAACIYDSTIKRLITPRGLSYSAPRSTWGPTFSVAWAWGALDNSTCHNEYDKIALVLNLTQADRRLVGIPESQGQSGSEDSLSIAKILNVLAIASGDYSLLLTGHGRQNKMVGIENVSWMTSTPIPSDIHSERWQARLYPVTSEQKPVILTSGIQLSGVALAITQHEEWIIWREKGDLYASVDGVTTTISSSTVELHPSFDINLNLRTLRDVLLVLAQHNAKHIYHGLIHAHVDRESTYPTLDIEDLASDMTVRFRHSTMAHMDLNRELNLARDEDGGLHLLYLRLDGGYAATVYGNTTTELVGRTLFQPYGARPICFGNGLFAVNALVLDGVTARPAIHGEAGELVRRRCVGQVRCFELLPECLGDCRFIVF